jgi:hypothetical protein
MPELLSAFVTPNHPALSAVNTAAAKYLEKWTGSSSLDAYQTQDRNRVRYQVAAVYEALRAQGIVYSEAPANFVKTGQRIRLADQVLSEKMGTCIDTTLLMASCLESIGIHPLIIIQEGHTFVGAWLDERCYSHNIGDDYTSLTKESADGIHNVVLVETTNITSSSPASFEDATTKAEQEIRDERAFVLFVDVCHCRLDGIKPLLPRDARYFLVAPKGERALPADRLAARLEGFDCTVCGDVKDGVRQALEAARSTPGCLLYIGGSNFVVAEAVGLFDPD